MYFTYIYAPSGIQSVHERCRPHNKTDCISLGFELVFMKIFFFTNVENSRDTAYLLEWNSFPGRIYLDVLAVAGN